MTEQRKQICMIASSNRAEALRMATGLTLLDDGVAVAVLGVLDSDDAIAEQMEALEFADVPVTELQGGDGVDALADLIQQADVVYCV